MEEILIKTIAGAGGVSGLLAALMFWVYMKESKDHMKRQDDHVDQLAAVNRQLIKVIIENTAAMTASVEVASSLRNIIAELARDQREREEYFRMHIAPVLTRLSPP